MLKSKVSYIAPWTIRVCVSVYIYYQFCFALVFMSLCFNLKNSLLNFLESRSLGLKVSAFACLGKYSHFFTLEDCFFEHSILGFWGFFFSLQLRITTLLPVLWDVCWESPCHPREDHTFVTSHFALAHFKIITVDSGNLAQLQGVSVYIFWVWLTWHFSGWVWEVEVMWTWTFRISEII